MRKQVEDFISSCDTCQKKKITGKNKYGKVPLVPALRDKQPWEYIQVDCAGSWTVRVKNSVTSEVNKYTIKVLTIVEKCMCG